MNKIPPASKVLTPAEYGVTAPDGQQWPLNLHAPDTYRVNRVYPTVQGEGGMVGTPMTILRLQGCPVGCTWCDTPETWLVEGEPRQATAIAEEVAKYAPYWALVTGGEPAWHDLAALTEALHAQSRLCALETSGAYLLTGTWDWVTVSPKPKGLIPFKRSALAQANEVKWIVGRGSDIDELEDFLATLGGPQRSPHRISIQPVSTNKRATQLCLDALMRRPDWHLSLQTHKFLEIA